MPHRPGGPALSTRAPAGPALARRAGAPGAPRAPVLGGLILALLTLPMVLSGCGPAPAAAGDPALSLHSDPHSPAEVTVSLHGRAAVELRRRLGTDVAQESVERFFHLTVKDGPSAAPLLARLEWREDRGVLTPQAPLTRGRTYQAVFEGPQLSASLPRLIREHRVPADRRPSSVRISGVFPPQSEVPSNLLKIYLHFSEPMAAGRVFEFIRLRDRTGRPIPQAFREVELWADEHRRLTLWVNPGRTKRALGLSESLGPVLESGGEYVLEVLPGLPDRQGRPLVGGLRHVFRTTGHDAIQPRMDDWKIHSPGVGTREPLAVHFPEPLDHALAGRLIRVETPSGETVEGEGRLDEAARAWRFTPRTAWGAGSYFLTAAGDLEDLAGNSLQRPFETRAGQGALPPATPPVFRRVVLIPAAP